MTEQEVRSTQHGSHWELVDAADTLDHIWLALWFQSDNAKNKQDTQQWLALEKKTCQIATDIRSLYQQVYGDKIPQIGSLLFRAVRLESDLFALQYVPADIGQWAKDNPTHAERANFIRQQVSDLLSEIKAVYEATHKDDAPCQD